MVGLEKEQGFMKKIFVLVLLFTGLSYCQAARRRVLFLGNSYTYSSDLPGMVALIAQSQGDTLVRDSYTPGGFTLRNHFESADARAKIALGNWDVVVIQAQSQEPSFPESQVQVQTLPYARKLDSLVRLSNPACTETLFFMTWGRKNGDAGNCPFYPPLCTYAGMQGQLRNRYLTMARETGGSVCPAGMVWSRSISRKPFIELYNSDQSHPSPAGTYLTALTFYTVLFEKKTRLPFYRPPGFADSTALFFRTTAEAVVWDSARTWFEHSHRARALFSSSQMGPGTFRFVSQSYAAGSLSWDTGSGFSPGGDTLVHSFSSAGWQRVRLRAWNLCRSDTAQDSVWVEPLQAGELSSAAEGFFRVVPNPSRDGFRIQGGTDLLEIFFADGRPAGSFSFPVRGEEAGTKLPPGVYLLRSGGRAVRWVKIP